MISPNAFSTLAEVKLEWKKLVNRLPTHVKGVLALVNTKRIATITEQFKYPIVAIEHENYLLLNKDFILLHDILLVLNTLIVHKIGGIKFVKPMEEEYGKTIDELIDTFDAEIIHIEEGEVL